MTAKTTTMMMCMRMLSSRAPQGSTYRVVVRH